MSGVKKVRLALVGGFLGSGKTTLIAGLVRKLSAAGLRVGVVTNDQGTGLVDTALFKALGVPTGEVPDGCFCCNFNRFVDGLRGVIAEHAPDVILAEPVGSCTDLTATVAAPLAAFHRNLADLVFFGVVADARRLADEGFGGLENPRTPGETLLAHQIRETPLLLLSKTDLASAEETAAAVAGLKRLNPAAEILPYSAVTGEGLEEVLAAVRCGRMRGKLTPVDLDYDLYARAEAELGWYNGSFILKAEAPFDPGLAGLRLLKSLTAEGWDIPHAKLYVSTPRGGFKLSLSRGILRADSPAAGPEAAVVRAALVFNVRAKTSPEAIAAAVDRGLRELRDRFGLRSEDYEYRALIPSPPKPTYRAGDDSL